MKLIAEKDYSGYPFTNLDLIEMPGEKFLSVPQFDGYLLVSNKGRVWALPRPIYSITGQFYYTKERIRKQSLNKVYSQYTKSYTEQLSVHMRYEGNSYGLL